MAVVGGSRPTRPGGRVTAKPPRVRCDRRSIHPTLERDIAASLAVAAFSIAVAAGFARVFSGWDFMRDLVVVVVVAHGVGLVVRRLSLSSWVAVPAIAAALVWAIAALYYPDTLSFGLPTGATWELFQLELTGVREQFQTAVAPVIYGAGWDVLAAIGLAIAALLADVFAFRAFARAETLVPGGVLFVFVGALGDDRRRVALTVVLVAVGVVTVVVLRMYSAAAATGTNSSVRQLWPAAIAAAVMVAALAGFIGPRLPGADAAPLYETRGRGGGVTEVVSPLVDIRSRLTNRSDSELFRVRASAESYWRTSALPEFDGTTWGLPERPTGVHRRGSGESAPRRRWKSASRSPSWTWRVRSFRLHPIRSRPPARPIFDGWRRPRRWSPSTAISKSAMSSTWCRRRLGSIGPCSPRRRRPVSATRSTPSCRTTFPTTLQQRPPRSPRSRAVPTTRHCSCRNGSGPSSSTASKSSRGTGTMPSRTSCVIGSATASSSRGRTPP